jgi:hypothetical protein
VLLVGDVPVVLCGVTDMCGFVCCRVTIRDVMYGDVYDLF